ncbi:protein NODULATION SIGNALING PATHWAY 2-like [Mangifera indica]|uniref:protein NODULATION SIGNALING PATHWAY 2-like n=1 Tax=Mangifera indica TaxID=29780 RepID=UPI001CF97778|nr:protein NODULATION SIGNALING PATHWAY 2-like [Mangifera indica]
MMQVEPFQYWPENYNSTDSPLEEIGLYFADKYAQEGCFEFPSPSISMEDFSNDGSPVLLSSPVYDDDDSQNLAIYSDDSPVMFPVEEYLLSSDDVDIPLNDQLMADDFEDFSELMVSVTSPVSPQLRTEEDAKSLNLSPISSEASSIDVSILTSDQTSLVFPSEDMEVDDQLSLLHLLNAYGEAMGLEQKDLATEIIRRLTEKAGPTGATLERLAYYLIQAFENKLDYLSQESNKNYAAAFRAFYQIFPYGRFAHFTANSMILEATPQDAGMVHIIDFDIGQGIQWPPLIEALGRRGQRLVQLTSIKWEEEDGSYFPPTDSFEETKRRLYEHARTFDVILMIEEMDMESLVTEMKIAKKCSRRNEWLAFNCMVGLPHIGRLRSKKHVKDFLKVAKDSLNNTGIVTFGNVSEVGGLDCDGIGSLFEEKLLQLQAFFQSMEWHFPAYLLEARVAMECLFMAPQVSSLAAFQNLEENSARTGGVLSEMGLKAWRLSKYNLMEAKELVSEGNSLYWVKNTGENEMVLGFVGTSLVKVSSWR